MCGALSPAAGPLFYFCTRGGGGGGSAEKEGACSAFLKKPNRDARWKTTPSGGCPPPAPIGCRRRARAAEDAAAADRQNQQCYHGGRHRHVSLSHCPTGRLASHSMAQCGAKFRTQQQGPLCRVGQLTEDLLLSSWKREDSVKWFVST